MSQIKKVKAEGRRSRVPTGTDGDDGEGEEDGGVGSLLWAAPEVLAGGRGDEKADVYAFGVMLWELMHWSEPFPGVAALKVAVAVSNGERPIITAEAEATVPGIGELMRRAWSHEKKNRPDFITLLQELDGVAEAMAEAAEEG